MSGVALDMPDTEAPKPLSPAPSRCFAEEACAFLVLG